MSTGRLSEPPSHWHFAWKAGAVLSGLVPVTLSGNGSSLNLITGPGTNSGSPTRSPGRRHGVTVAAASRTCVTRSTAQLEGPGESVELKAAEPAGLGLGLRVTESPGSAGVRVGV
jgi:hypothetical protein